MGIVQLTFAIASSTTLSHPLFIKLTMCRDKNDKYLLHLTKIHCITDSH